MRVRSYRRDTCRLCGRAEMEPALLLTPTPPADAYVPAERLGEAQESFPIDLMLCRVCGFSQLADIVSPEDVYIDYIYETTSSLGLADHFDRYAGEIEERIQPQPGALVVDVGSNDGTLLRAFRDRGQRVLGIDPAREIARRATDAGIETLPEFLTVELAERIRAEHGPAAVITANNIYANVDDLDEFTRAIRALLAPDGVFVFESFYLADLMQNMVFDFIYHEHLSYFSVKPLLSFFAKHDMELIDALRVPTKGGSLRYTVQLAGAGRPVSSAVAGLVAHEEGLGVQSIGAFRAFDERVGRAKDAVLDFVREVKGAGKTIAGYGASATTTTLMYHFDLNGAIDFLVDEYPAKQNLFSPGAHIPVLPPEALYDKRPDYVFVTAWRYYDPIREKNRRYLDAGGHFIVPLPTLVVE
jgi:SAM-dependent methyltransferase